MLNRPAIIGLALVGALAALPGCASKNKSSNDGVDGAVAEAAATAESNADDWYKDVYKDGRYYVFGQEKTYEAWKETHHMPYTRTQIGAGPRGETLVFEIDKKWPELTDWLEKKFAYEHWTDQKPYYATMNHDGRIYVFGNAKTHEAFKQNGHMPYTRTQIGAGPNRETLVFEIDKKDPALTDWLEKKFEREGAPAGTAGFYAEMVKDGRYYVFGQSSTEASFKKNGHMPYTRTLVGAGPSGMTVVLEIDKKDEALTDRIQTEFSRRHGALR